MSQENVSDKVRNIQRQIAHNIKFGQKPLSLRKSEGDEGSSDEEEVPRRPLQVLAQVEPEPLEAEAREKVLFATHDVTQHRTPVKSPRAKRPPPPGTIESINLDSVPQSAQRLDNTAAKHKLSIKPKNQRVSRKHRRFVQGFLEVDITAVVQEQTDSQNLVEGAAVWREEYVRSRIIDNQETPEKSKKQRLQEEEQESLEIQRRHEEEEEEEAVEQRRREEEQRAEELRLEQERMRSEQEEFLRRLEEERRQWEEERRREEEERMREEEERMREEEERVREEEERMREEEEMRRQEEERKQQEEERRREEEHQRRKMEEEQLLREEEERKRLEEERKKIEEERRRAEEERRQQELAAERLRLEEERRQRDAEEERRKKEEEEAEKQRLLELEEKQRREEQARLQEERRKQQEEEEAEIKRLADEKRRKEEDERKQQEEARAAEEYGKASDPEWKRKAEELRWREIEERQRPFTFKVSSGEKQILFQKVNLSPVTPVTPDQPGDPADEVKESTPGVAESSTLSSSMYVPHTAILVTGAQLCGTAVNLDQIKDTACKSLLGLSEDKKALGMPLAKSKTSPDRKTGKVKSLNESILSADQSSAAVLAEWASIRSRIFKSSEDGTYQEYPDQNRNQPNEEDDQPPFAHTNIRKTMSANARFSIISARKKFADSNRNSEVFSQVEQEGGTMGSPSSDSDPGQSVQSPSSPSKVQNKGGKVVRISDSAEEFKFAKDLPSFLVPSLPHESPKSQTGPLSQVESGESDTTDYGDQRDQSGDENPLPFGIKLRRTNYSLRFHSEQSTEKRKKRYSAGDSFDGVPVPLTSTDHDCAFSEKTSPAASPGERVDLKVQAVRSAEPRSKPGRSPLSSVCSETDKPPLYQKPATLPKPSDVATSSPSPLPKPGRRSSGDTVSQRIRGPELTAAEPCSENKEAPLESVQSQKNGQGDDEPKEKKSFFPSISIPWREKTDRRTELIRREKPSLQSRHSLDSSRSQEKETGPLWITLALQKQKGFREQQLTREERRNQREAKLAEKQARERELAGVVSPTDSKGNENTSPPKAQTPEENKRPETLLARFERRDNLKKSNTLPSSVTVEIADSTPSPPAAKDIKRFPPSDSPQVSTEPAWLALAKRKAKAWSDCPQIIK